MVEAGESTALVKVAPLAAIPAESLANMPSAVASEVMVAKSHLSGAAEEAGRL